MQENAGGSVMSDPNLSIGASSSSILAAAGRQVRSPATEPSDQLLGNTDSKASEADVSAVSFSVEKLEELIAVANQALEGSNNKLRFQIDETRNRPTVSVVNHVSGDVIRQLPSEELIRISKSIELMKGILFDITA
jgi:flagellar protein FlaG